eukprot:3596240-Amphidinium_carterae.2
MSKSVLCLMLTLQLSLNSRKIGTCLLSVGKHFFRSWNEQFKEGAKRWMVDGLSWCIACLVLR